MTALDIKTDASARGTHWEALPSAGDLFGELHLAESSTQQTRHPLFPGLAACGAAAGTAAWLSDHYGFPVILLGLLVGLALNFIAANEATHRGLDFASRTFLRIGIVVLGLQVTFAQIGMLGAAPLAALIAVMAVTMAAGIVGARFTGQSLYAGLLAGGATAICGASAALAVYGVIGAKRLPQAQFALTLVGVSLASALAMTLYPPIAGAAGLDDAQAGFLIGASIHDVAQAIGGGYAFSDAAGVSATIVKLARVAMLAPIVAAVGLFLVPEDGKSTRIWRRLVLPWFIVAFFAMVTLNSVAPIPEVVRSGGLTASKALLLLAVTATAMRTRWDLLLETGWRAGVPVLLASLASFGISLIFALTIV